MSLSETFLISPLSVSGCQLWLDAADSTTVIRSGTNVTQWNDKSGKNNTAVAGTFTYPVYEINSLNSLATVKLRASNDYFLVNNNFDMNTFPSLCYFIVVRPASTQPNNTYAGVLSTDTPGQFGRTLAFGGGSYQQEYYSGFTNITAYTAEQWAIVSLQFITTVSATLFVNSTSYAGTATATGNNTTGLKIGSYNDTSSYSTFNANFDCAEILVYGNVVTTADRQKIEGYLAWKWGLTANLPSNHPYKNSRPLDNIPLPTSLLVQSRPLRNVFVFNPTVLSNCVLWLDGADVSTMFQDTAGALPVRSTGSTVALWRDKSVSDNDIVST